MPAPRQPTPDPNSLRSDAAARLQDVQVSEDVRTKLEGMASSADSAIRDHHPVGGTDVAGDRQRFAQSVRKSWSKLLDDFQSSTKKYVQQGMDAADASARALREICPVYPFCE